MLAATGAGFTWLTLVVGLVLVAGGLGLLVSSCRH
jgi:hypothetical protein